MATRVERGGIEGCIAKINSAIDQLNEAASTIDKTMGEIPSYWEGAAHDKAQATYDSEYKGLLTNTVPQAVENFREYINGCKEKIIELDEMLAGNG